MMIAQEDKELWNWIDSAYRNSGSFIRALTKAAMVADAENYALLRPVLLVFKNKYRKYDPNLFGPAVKPDANKQD